MQRFSAKQWFTRTAQHASAETGRRGRNFILAHMRAVMGLDAPRKKAARAAQEAPSAEEAPYLTTHSNRKQAVRRTTSGQGRLFNSHPHASARASAPDLRGSRR
jgi:hypothetical protein